MNERERALRNVQITTFALVEANLFLDSHPEDPAAIEYFQKYRTLYERAVADYECNFGPLTAKSGVEKCRWRWVETPWPWEYEANCK